MDRHKRAVAAIGIVIVLCILAGAAVKYSYRLQDQNYEVKNDDYCLRIEDVLADGDVKSVLVSVEALNEESNDAVRNSVSCPNIGFSDLFGFGSSGSGSITSYGEYGAKRYFMCEWNAGGNICTVQYADNIPKIPDDEWLKEHGDEILSISFRVEDKMNKVIKMNPEKNEFPEGITIEAIEIRGMCIKVQGCRSRWSQGEAAEAMNVNFCPTVTAIRKDGTCVRLMQGDMGYDGEETDEIWYSGSGGGRTGGDGKITKMEKYELFRKTFELDDVVKVRVNDVEYNVER